MSENFYDINDELLAKYLLGETTAEEKAAIENWIRADKLNQKYFEDFLFIWTESKNLALTSEVDETAAWGRFKSRISEPSGSSQFTPRSRSVSISRSFFRIAAVFILIIGIVLIGRLIFQKEDQVRMVTANTDDKTKIEKLNDGSVVTLNKNSSLQYPDKFIGNEREVTLKGEGFFQVSPDKSKPFIVHVNDITVKVVGTSFNVRTINGKTEVIVETGIVQVSRKNKMIELRPKEKIQVSQQDSILAKQKETEKLYNYYRTKEFVCDNTPLWKLVEVLNEAYQVNIIIQRPQLRGLPLNTTFSNESLDHILEVIRLTFDITVEKESDKIVLR
ncbi:MAG: FecR family protein [Flavisolibacter sp.]